MSKFVIYKDLKGEYRWRFKANNGEIIAVASEGYTQKVNATHAINLIKEQAYGANVEDTTSTNSLYRFI